MREVKQSRKLADVTYEIRGPVAAEARRLEREGHQVMRLNVGNPAAFGFSAPDEILQDVLRNLHRAQGYVESKGLFSARKAVVQHYQSLGLLGLDVEDVYLGNGVSELIVLALQGLLDDGDEVLVPAPDYPLWTAATSLSGGRPVHYLCDEGADWFPDVADLEAKVTPRTRAVVLINPNNPTGAVYSRELLEAVLDVARRHDLVVLSDEIYDKVLYDDAEHVVAATLAPDLLCLTFNGLSKAYRAAGFRSGWMVVSGPREHASSFVVGLDVLASLRLCANVPAQFAIQTALGGRQSIRDLVLPGGRLLAQRDLAHELLESIPGVSCVKPRGALYAFPRLDPRVHPIVSDERFALDLLRRERVLVVHGTGFNWPSHDHFRVVTLPHVDDLTDAIGRIGRFLSTYRQ